MRTTPIETPGHLIRRVQQISVSLFHNALEKINITPIQYLVLLIVEDEDGLDQITVSSKAALDASTSGDVLRRLERRGYIIRKQSELDRRSRAVFITDSGRSLLNRAEPYVVKTRESLLEPLSAEERKQFLSYMKRLVEHHEGGYLSNPERPWRRLRR